MSIEHRSGIPGHFDLLRTEAFDVQGFFGWQMFSSNENFEQFEAGSRSR
jgi:hypothetical protein